MGHNISDIGRCRHLASKKKKIMNIKKMIFFYLNIKLIGFFLKKKTLLIFYIIYKNFVKIGPLVW